MTKKIHWREFMKQHGQNELFLEKIELFRLIFDNLYNGALITDKKGYILYFNKPYGDFLGIDPRAQIGKHCTEVIANSRMHLVAESGEPEINQVLNIKGQNMIVQRIPIKHNKEVIAVFGQIKFYDISHMGELIRKISHLESKVAYHDQVLSGVRSTNNAQYEFKDILSQIDSMKALKKKALNMADSDFPVLIYGESGTGKELFAQAVHNTSSRRHSPFVKINCGAIPRELAESELFGYEKGAFTGADTKGKPGKFELAHKGTIFLDEIGELPFDLQSTLLNILEEKTFERIGGTSRIRTDFRLIAATNQDIERMLIEKRFRDDLFYRLNVLTLNIPPLRDRRDDIIMLAYYFLDELIQENNFQKIQLTSEVEHVLKDYSWPGNVRELKNLMKKLIFQDRKEDDVIHVEDLPLDFIRDSNYQEKDDKNRCNFGSFKDMKSVFEKEIIARVLKENNFNKRQTAKQLGIHRSLLYNKIKKYKIAS